MYVDVPCEASTGRLCKRLGAHRCPQPRRWDSWGLLQVGQEGALPDHNRLMVQAPGGCRAVQGLMDSITSHTLRPALNASITWLPLACASSRHSRQLLAALREFRSIVVGCCWYFRFAFGTYESCLCFEPFASGERLSKSFGMRCPLVRQPVRSIPWKAMLSK